MVRELLPSRMLTVLQRLRKHPLFYWLTIPAGLLSAWLNGGRNTMIDFFLIMGAGFLTIVLVDLALFYFKSLFRFVVRLSIGSVFIYGGIYTDQRIFKPEQVQVAFRYAYEECAYRGAALNKDEDRIILASEPIKRIFRPDTYYPFRLGIHKGNPGLPMRFVMMQVIFLVDDEMIAKGYSVRTVSGKGFWQEEEVNKRGSTRIGVGK